MDVGVKVLYILLIANIFVTYMCNIVEYSDTNLEKLEEVGA